MLELEENLKKLELAGKKLQDLGESLWHKKLRNKIKRIRKSNNENKFLARCTKLK